MIENPLRRVALAPGLITFSRWTLQVLPGIGSVCVILCMSKQITVSGAKVGGAKHTLWGTMEPNWKGAMFLTVSFTKHPFASVEYDFKPSVLSLCFVLAFNTTLLVKEHQNILFLYLFFGIFNHNFVGNKPSFQGLDIVTPFSWHLHEIGASCMKR